MSSKKEKNRERFREKLEKIRPKSRSRYEIMSQMFQVFGKLEVLKADWKPYIESVEQKLFGQGEAFYQEAFARFEREVCKEERWEIYLEQLMVYFLFTYFCGAIRQVRLWVGKESTVDFLWNFLEMEI